jgi:hypothetical protein
MKRTPVTSSTVASVGYDPNSMTLEIEFTSSSVYQYFDVPEAEYRNLISAESIGKFFNQNIKDKYPWLGSDKAAGLNGRANKLRGIIFAPGHVK